MLVIREEEFEMVQTSGPFFDLSLPTKVNEGKSNERTEMKLVGHGVPFETCLQYLVGLKMSAKEGICTVKEYVKKYEETVKEVSLLFKTEEKPKRTKKVEDGEIE